MKFIQFRELRENSLIENPVFIRADSIVGYFPQRYGGTGTCLMVAGQRYFVDVSQTMDQVKNLLLDSHEL